MIKRVTMFFGRSSSMIYKIILKYDKIKCIFFFLFQCHNLHSLVNCLTENQFWLDNLHNVKEVFTHWDYIISVTSHFSSIIFFPFSFFFWGGFLFFFKWASLVCHRKRFFRTINCFSVFFFFFFKLNKIDCIIQICDKRA